MADTFQEIKAALIKEFKGKFPAYAVSCEDLQDGRAGPGK